MENLTPHEITIIDSKTGKDIVFPPHGIIARVQMEHKRAEDTIVEGLSVATYKRNVVRVEGLPDDDTPCIVSSIVLAAVPNRPNTYAPDTGSSAIRDDKGQIKAVRSLIKA